MDGTSPSKAAGFGLAALLAGDRELAAIEHAIPPDLYDRVRALLGDGSDAHTKARLVATLLARVRPTPTSLPDDLPLRLRALLAPKLPRASGRVRGDVAPPLRADYAPPSDLLPRLLRLARRSIEAGGDRG